MDTLDLYQAKARAACIATASAELGLEPGVIKADLGKVLLKLEELQDENIRKQLKGEKKRAEIFISESEREEALALLKAPNLLDRVLADFAACGVVGEETNKLVGYLAATSRKLENPLAVVIQSSSSAGKSSLMEAVLALMPPEEVVKYSAMTGQALYYLGETDIKHRILAIAEEAGASRAAYALKLLQSEGEISIASTGKDPQTGKLITQQYRVEGPAQIFLTTTAIDLDEELLNRCLVLTVSEDQRQTAAIHEEQRIRQTMGGLLAKGARAEILKRHQIAQRCLRQLPVVNPFALELKFSSYLTRARRDHLKYLALIRAIALLHQHQRQAKEIEHPRHPGELIEYIEVEPRDIEIANRLAAEILDRSLEEIPPQTMRLLEKVRLQVAAECERRKVERTQYRFTRRDVRAWTGWSDFQVGKHLRRLAQLEYLAVSRTSRGGVCSYELTQEVEDTGGPARERKLELVTPRLMPLTQSLLPPGSEVIAPPSPLLAGHSTPENPAHPPETIPEAPKFLQNPENHVVGVSEKERNIIQTGRREGSR